MVVRALRKPLATYCASGDVTRFPSSAMIAPAPRSSSSAGRSVPSGQRSPAAITAMGPFAACLRANAATDDAFRKHPTTIRASVSVEATLVRVAPFGEGRTRRACLGSVAKVGGDSVYGARLE